MSSPSSSRVFVTGATGTTGLATLKALRAAGVEVVAGVHSPDKSGQLDAFGVAIRQIDYADVASMAVAMEGADRLFLVTPVSHKTAAFTSAIVEAAKAAGVAHVAKLSGLDVDAEPGSTLGHWHLAAEKVIEASGLAWTFLRANAFMQNFLGDAGTIKQLGTYFSVFGETPVNFIDARDIGEVAAKVLTSQGHAGNTYSLTGPRAMTNAQVSELLSVAAGKPVTCTAITAEHLCHALKGYGVPAVEAGALAELLGLIATGTAARTSPDVERLLGRPPREFARFAADFAGAFR